MDPEYLSAFPEALGLFRRWSRRHYGQDWEDAVQDGIVRLLETERLVVVSVPMLLVVMQRGASNAFRHQHGRAYKSRLPRLVYCDPAFLASLAGTDPACLLADQVSAHQEVRVLLGEMSPLVQTVLQAWAMGDGPSHIAQHVHRSQPRITQILGQYAPAWQSWHTRERLKAS